MARVRFSRLPLQLPDFGLSSLTSLHSRSVVKKAWHCASNYLSRRCHKPTLTAALDQSTRANRPFSPNTDNNTNAGRAYKFHRLEVGRPYNSSLTVIATNKL